MTNSANQIKLALFKYILERHSMDESEFDKDDNLWEEGILDSMDIQEFIVFLEKQFIVKIEQRHFRDKRFFSVQGLSEMLVEMQGEV